MSKPSSPRRPFGVTVIVILQLISILVLVANISILEVVNKLVGTTPSQLLNFLGGWHGNGDLALLIKSALVLVVLVITIGLWRLQRWAWVLIMLQLGIGMGILLWLYFNGKPLYISMLINVIMVFYLNQQDVQQAFEQQTQPQESLWTT